MKRQSEKKINGFTLIELVIVMGMLTIMMAAVYGVYEVHQRSAYTQDEVVEVQQNLRIAMDQMSRDIRNAGILIPSDPPPALTAVGNVGDGAGVGGSDTLLLNTASASGRYAVIDKDYWPGNQQFAVTTVESLDKFVGTDKRVKIIRVSSNKSEPATGSFTITNLVRPTKTFIIATSGVTDGYKAGDVIVGTTENARPETISYCVGPGAGCGPIGPNQCPPNQQCLVRIENGNATVIATNIIDLQFSYLMQGILPETPNPVNLNQIRAIRIRLTGSTLTTGTRQRELTSVVNLRNGTES